MNNFAASLSSNRLFYTIWSNNSPPFAYSVTKNNLESLSTIYFCHALLQKVELHSDDVVYVRFIFLYEFVHSPVLIILFCQLS